MKQNSKYGLVVATLCLIALPASVSRAQNQTTIPVPTLNFVTPAGQPRCEGSEGYGADFEGRRTFLWRPQSLQALKSASSAEARRQVIERANAALRRAPVSVVSKTKTPLSGEKHDYYSMGPYWWPDASKPNGEPYVRRDGVVNPERNGDGFDVTKLNALSSDVTNLALAHYYTSDARYATKVAALVRAWFLDSATKMNPNFAYAQSVPGVSAGRPEGIIDGHRLLFVIESVGLIAPSGALSGDEMRQLEAWFGDMANWMATSENGLAEKAKANNHGIYYDLILTQFAMFSRQTQRATDTINRFGTDRIAQQFSADGGLQEELSRTRSWHYSHWTLAATGRLAGLGECVGLDLWRTTMPDGRGLAKSLSFMARYVAREQDWRFPESAFQPGGNVKAAREIALENFRIAAWGYKSAAYEGLANYYARQVPDAGTGGWLAPYK